MAYETGYLQSESDLRAAHHGIMLGLKEATARFEEGIEPLIPMFKYIGFFIDMQLSNQRLRKITSEQKLAETLLERIKDKKDSDPEEIRQLYEQQRRTAKRNIMARILCFWILCSIWWFPLEIIVQPGLWLCLILCWKPVQRGKVTEKKVLRLIWILNLLYWVEMMQGGIAGLRLCKEFEILKGGLKGLMNSK